MKNLAKNPAKGGIPAIENKIKLNVIAIKGFKVTSKFNSFK
jgi:hypothetical protein